MQFERARKGFHAVQQIVVLGKGRNGEIQCKAKLINVIQKGAHFRYVRNYLKKVSKEKV